MNVRLARPDRSAESDVAVEARVVDGELDRERQIIRDRADRLIDIIEEEEARDDWLDIMELNVGAYVFHADVLYPTLETLRPSPIDGEYRLTDCVHSLIRSRRGVESYRIYDEGEVQGVNTAADLERAGIDYTVIELNPATVQEQSRRGRPVIFGDVGNLRVARVLAQIGHDAPGIIGGIGPFGALIRMPARAEIPSLAV